MNEKSKKEEGPNLDHERVLHPLGSRSFERKSENAKKDVDDLKDPEKV